MSLAYSESIKYFYVSQSKNTNAATDSTGTEKLTSFVSLGRKLIMTIEMQFYLKLRANFKLNKSENLLIRNERQRIIDIQSFVDGNVIGRKQPSNHFQSSECFIYAKNWILYQASFIRLAFVSQMLIYKCPSGSQRILKTLYPVINTHNNDKCLALFFHDDSPWSKTQMSAIKCWVENVLEKKADFPKL